jgi:hypothetical protein
MSGPTDGVAISPRVRKEIRVDVKPAIQSAASLVRAFPCKTLLLGRPDLLEAQDVTDRAAKHYTAQSGHGSQPQVSIHSRSVEEQPHPRHGARGKHRKSACHPDRLVWWLTAPEE